MAQVCDIATCSSLWLLLIIFSALPTYNGAIAIAYYVRPSSASNATCPDQPCLTFNDYAREKDQYFLDGGSFVFLSGMHQLDLQLRLENVSNASLGALESDSSTQILLSPMVNITWLDSNNVTISGLEIFLTGLSNDRILFSALVFGNTTNCSFSRMNFLGSDRWQSTAIRTHTSIVTLRDVTISGAASVYGAALIAFNSTINFAGQNSFVNNTASQAGAMAIGQSVVNFLVGQNYFINNNAVQGGALTLSQSIANFQGNITFINNVASTSNIFRSALGGAIYSENSVLSFSGSVLLQRNKAISTYGAKGGGISAQLNSKLIFEESSSAVFAENSASFIGGAITVSRSELVLRGNALFESNVADYGGGGLRGEANAKILFAGTEEEEIIFRDNYVSRGVLAAGGAIYTHLSDLKLEGILFERNMAGSGGAISSGDIIMHIDTCDFHNNTATFGGAVLFMGTDIIFNGTNNFQWNFAGTGGTVSVNFANVIFSGENNFSNNNVTNGPGSLTLSVSSGFICGNLTFHRNHAFVGGGLQGNLSNLTICGSNLFTENSADIFGGGMMFFTCNLNITGQASFIQNTASGDGSAVFIRNSNATIGGSINISNSGSSLGNTSSLSFRYSVVILTGMLVLENNAGFEGGAINARDSDIEILGCVQCFNNLARLSGGGLFARNSKINFRNDSDCNIFQSNVAGYRGGALSATESTIITFLGSQKFSYNSAIQGGAIAFDSSSKLVLSHPLQASFVENDASVGGAIFYEDTFSARQCAESIMNSDRSDCFIELDSTSDVQINFLNNSAESAGTVLYGGDLDRCRLYVGGGMSDSCGNRIGGNYSYSPFAEIKKISSIIRVNNVTSDISSDPLQVCYCVNDIQDCSGLTIDTLRGKEFTLMAFVVGQSGGVIPSSVRTSLDNDIQIRAEQRIQTTGKECTPINYRLSSKKNATTLVLFPDGPCRDANRSRSEITINFLPCPNGFTLDGSECVCEERLQRYTNSCSVDDSSIRRDSNTFWVGAVYENGTFGGLILHSGCPFDYCVDTPVLIELDNVDIQCDHNHSGILCGSCTSGYSVVFSSLHCLPCSNAYLGLTLPFILAGFVLVIILLLLKLSVVNGTINGLIFYANVIQVNRSIFFPPGDTNILTVFIAWLNLDLGIKTCFFDGMNTYIFTWLQFVFPLYVWFLIGLIIVLSRFSTKIARTFGRNPVAALATLFLLSYSKILRTIIVALSFTTLEYPGKKYQAVWLYDGNILYFESTSHIILGTFAIVILLLLFLPYTLLLLCGHWLQAYSDRWLFSWLNKIMPLMDAYHAPFKMESRYWTGFLLLVRCALFLTFAFNSLGNASGNLLAIVSVTAGLLILSWLSVKIYKIIFNDFLEAAFLLNLCVLAAGTYHVKEIGGNQAALAYTLVGIAFVLFICILLYHVYLRLHTTLLWKKFHCQGPYMFNKLRHNMEKDTEANMNSKQKSERIQLPTITTIELDACEPMLT